VARLHTMLVVEGFAVGQTTVKAAVAEWKRKRREVFVPLVYPAGDLAEGDFFEVLIELAGAMVKAWMFVMRLMHSGRDFAWLYLRQDQPSFLEGHVRAFQHFGCVPQRIAYDNLKAAVAKILVGSERQLASRCEALSCTICSSRASAGRAPATTRAAWSRAVRTSAGSTWCPFPVATTWARCAEPCSHASTPSTIRPGSPPRGGSACRYVLVLSTRAARTRRRSRRGPSSASRAASTRSRASGRGST